MTGWPIVEALKTAVPSHYQEFYVWVFLNQLDQELKVTQQWRRCSDLVIPGLKIFIQKQTVSSASELFLSTVNTVGNPDFILSTWSPESCGASRWSVPDSTTSFQWSP